MENIFYLIIGAILGATFTGLMFWFDVGYGRAATPVINMELLDIALKDDTTVVIVEIKNSSNKQICIYPSLSYIDILTGRIQQL